MNQRRFGKQIFQTTAAIGTIAFLLAVSPMVAVGQTQLLSLQKQESENALILKNSPVNGRLDRESEKLEDGSYFQVHSFEAKAGEQITIELTSKDFDPYLILRDSQNQKITEDDDSGTQNNAKIIVTLPANGTYKIVVTSYKASETGEYRVSWRKTTSADLELAEAEQLNREANELSKQGKYREAIPLAERALAIRKRLLGEEHPHVATSINNLAFLYSRQGRYTEAVKFFSQGLELEEINLERNLIAGSESQKRNYLKTVSGTTDSIISLHLDSARNNSAAARLALTTILQRKGRILDFMSNSQQILRRSLDSQSQALLDDLNKVRTEIANLYYKPPQKNNLQQYRQQLATLQERAKELENKISRRSAEFRTQSQPVTLEAIQKLIPRDAVLVELVKYYPYNAKDGKWLAPRYAAYILRSQGEPQGIDLGEANTIEQALIDFRAYLEDSGTPIDKQLKPSARQLNKLLMQPVLQHLGNTKTILLSPDSNLNLIPFEALVDENNSYLVENYRFTYLTSGRDLLRLANKYPSEQPPVVLADPIFNREAQIVAIQNNLRSGGDLSKMEFPPLPDTEVEAEEIKKLLPEATILTRSRASEQFVKQVNSPKILHIATHGFFLSDPSSLERERGRVGEWERGRGGQNFALSENPLLLSGLVLAGFKVGSSGGEDDGVLTALEATSIDLVGTKLVVLSACDTGRGLDLRAAGVGDGVYGLRRAFVIAGAESQLISLWKVEDYATKELIVDYYENLTQKRQGRSQALRQVQLEMLQNQEYQHPYYWASFVLSGDWRAMDN